MRPGLPGEGDAKIGSRDFSIDHGGMTGNILIVWRIRGIRDRTGYTLISDDVRGIRCLGKGGEGISGSIDFAAAR